MAAPRFHVRTYGCQMNVHDVEKVSNLLFHHGWKPAVGEDDADLVLIETCSIREKAEHRLYTDIGLLREWKLAAQGRILGVGGCVAQHEGDSLLRRFKHLDFVFGPHNLRHVPTLVEAARAGVRTTRTEESRSLERFDLPDWHPDWQGRTPGRAFVTAMEGCDMFCSFCIVPLTRGREVSRPEDAIVAEVEGLARRGVREVTLLGQTVNAWARHTRRRTAAETGSDFSALLRRLAGVPGIARIRYTSPHPLFFDDGLVTAHRELEPLCPHVHLPVQSGSDPVLQRMRRRYTRDDYRRLVERLRAARADLALTTDVIVGFPGESDADFQATLDLVREVAFVDSFSFKYSPRPGTAAARLGDEVPPGLAQERLEILQALQRDLTVSAHRGRIGQQTEVLLEGPSRRGSTRLQGRDPYHRWVHVDPHDWEEGSRPGDFLRVELVEATPHSLIGVPPGPGRGAVKPAAARADEEGRNSALA